MSRICLTGSWRDLRAASTVALVPGRCLRCALMLITGVLGSLLITGAFAEHSGTYYSALLRLDLSSVLSAAGQSFAKGSACQFALLGVWNYLVWGFFAGAVFRSAAVQWTTLKSPGAGEAAIYARRHAFAFHYAPLLAILGMAIFYCILSVGGLLVRIPAVGEIIAIIFLPFAVLFALPIVYFGVVLTLGLPLLWGAVSADGSDSFDAIGRASEYVFARPWKLLGHLALVVLYGIRFSTVVVAGGAAVLTAAVVAGWKGLGPISAGSKLDPVVGDLWQQTVGLFCSCLHPPCIPAGDLTGAPLTLRACGWAAKLMALVYLAGLGGIIVSYFVSAAQGIYLLLRLAVDHTPMSQLAEKAEAEDAPAAERPDSPAQDRETDAQDRPNGAGPKEEEN